MAATVPPGVDLTADRGPEIIRNTAAVASLATVVVIARLVSRRIQKSKWNLSDYTIVVGLIGCWALTAVVIDSRILLF